MTFCTSSSSFEISLFKFPFEKEKKHTVPQKWKTRRAEKRQKEKELMESGHDKITQQ